MIKPRSVREAKAITQTLVALEGARATVDANVIPRTANNVLNSVGPNEASVNSPVSFALKFVRTAIAIRTITATRPRSSRPQATAKPTIQ